MDETKSWSVLSTSNLICLSAKAWYTNFAVVFNFSLFSIIWVNFSVVVQFEGLDTSIIPYEVSRSIGG